MTAPEGGGPDPGEVLADLPASLLQPLVRAVRRAADELSLGELPASLRPFARWKPDRLLGAVPRRALAAALESDQRLREAAAEHLAPEASYPEAAEADARRLVDRFGAATAVAALALQGRWADVAVVGAEAGVRAATRRQAASEAAPRRVANPDDRKRQRLPGELAAARQERDEQRRATEAAAAELRRERVRAQRLEDDVAALRQRVAELEALLTVERRRSQRREAALRRRLEEARHEGRAAAEQARGLAEEVEKLAARLRESARPQREVARRGRPDQPALPRDVPAAAPGRPCRLPPGVRPDTAAAVRSLLQVPGLRVLVDGYNVTKDPAGPAAGPLEEQRRWLLQLAGGLAGRYRRQLWIVFDGADRLPPGPSPRGVQVVFTASGETADDRILHLAGADPDTPLLVVSSDGEVRAGAAAAEADVASAAAFLDAARA